MIDVAENHSEMLSPIAGLDAGGQDGFKMGSRWVQDGFKMAQELKRGMQK